MEQDKSFAEEAGLKYVHDHQPGFQRRRRGKGFVYLDPQNCRVTCENTLHRIHGLVIPPAWEGVWICRFANGHLQATGRDARLRKQYRYHNKWSVARNENKFDKLLEFSNHLPSLRQQIMKDLRRDGLGKQKVLAALVRVMELTCIRIGNDIYAAENDSYGLTTILNQHAKVRGDEVRFRFRGKSGVQHEVSFTDHRLSRIVRRCQHLPGEDLFEFVDANGVVHDIGSSDVNHYLHDLSGVAITAKDFRTWAGTVKAAEILRALGPAPELSERARKKRELEVIRQTAAHLRNTVSVCRKYYVHPMLFSADRSGSLHRWRKPSRRDPFTAPEQLVRHLLR